MSAPRGAVSQRFLVPLKVWPSRSPTWCSRRPMPAMPRMPAMPYAGCTAPAAQRREFASASWPTPMPPGATSHVPVREPPRRRGACRPRAQAAGRLQRVLKACAACHQSSTIVAFGSASRCSRHSPASPSHNTVAGVSAVTPAAASAAFLNASDAIAGLLRAKAKRDWFPSASMTLPRLLQNYAVRPAGAGCGRNHHRAPQRRVRPHRRPHRPAWFCFAPCPRSVPAALVHVWTAPGCRGKMRIRRAGRLRSCPAFSTRRHDRWPRWYPRSKPKRIGGFESRYSAVLWIVGSTDRHLISLFHPGIDAWFRRPPAEAVSPPHASS